MSAATAETAIVQRLLDVTDVTNAVGTRIWLNAAPQKKDADILPYIVIQMVDKQHAHHLQGASGIAWTRLQLNIVAANYRSAKEVAATIWVALGGFRGQVDVNGEAVQIKHCMMDSEQDNFDPPIDGSQKGRHLVIQDWKIANEEIAPLFSGI